MHREAVISRHLNLGLHFLVSRHSLDPCPSGPKAEANLHCRMDSDRTSPRFLRWLGGMEGRQSIELFHVLLENIECDLYLEGSPPSSAPIP